MVNLSINGRELSVEKNTNILEAAKSLNIEIPTLCYHQTLKPSGACRICLVEVEKNGKKEITASCSYPVSEGIKVYTDTPEVKKARQIVAQLTLARTPENAEIKKLAQELGVTESPYKSLDSSENCILCGRCVQMCREVMGVGAIDFVKRGANRVLQAPFQERSTICQECGACAFICPTGAIDALNLWGHQPKPNPSEFEEFLVARGNIHRPFPSAVPSIPVIDRENCVHFKTGLCSVCEKVCVAGAIDYEQQEKITELEVGAVVFATGFERFNAERLGEFGFGRYKNVVTSLQFERILSASGPTMGIIERPSDHKHPKKIAFLQCIGSRDQRTHTYCSSFCCMQATKEAMVAKEHDPELEATIFFMDLRAFGKGFESYWNRAEKEMGIKYLRSQISSVKELPFNKNIRVTYVDPESGQKSENDFDLLILSVGVEPSKTGIELAEKFGVKLNPHNFIETKDFSPVESSVPGVLVTGMFSGPKDIPETVMQASAAAGKAATILAEARNTEISKIEYPPEKDVAEETPRIGVFICHCGINIASTVNVSAVAEFATKLPYVVHVERNLFTCSQDSQQNIKQRIQEHNLNRVVVASCTPRMHEPIFQDTLREAGLNRYLFEMGNIREQCSWAHQSDPISATEKAKMIVAMTVSKAAHLTPLTSSSISVTPVGLVIGGGLAGIMVALSLAGQGFEVHLIEKEAHLGGQVKRMNKTLSGENIAERLKNLIQAIEENPLIHIHLEATPDEVSGHVGHFEMRLSNGEELTGGTIIVATGAKEHKPKQFLYAEHKKVITQLEFEESILKNKFEMPANGTVAMIQCVGSRDEQHPYCSRVCCGEAVKNALEIKKKYPEANVVVLYRDIRTYSFSEDYYLEARKAGVVFLRYEEDKPPQVSTAGDKLILIHQDPIFAKQIKFNLDWLILSAGIEALQENKKLGEILKVPITEEGFFLEAHAKLRPVDFASEGIFLAGLAHAPKTVDETVSQALAAAGRASTILCRETLEASAVVSKVDPDLCVACLTCVRLCPFGAPEFGEDGVVHIPAVKCQGCGLCAAECPARAIQLSKFQDDQIEAQIEALV